MPKKVGRSTIAHRHINNIQRWQGRLYKEHYEYHHHHIESGNGGYEQMDNQIILEREHKKPRQRKAHNIDQLGLGVAAHDIEKAVEFFDVGDTVEQIDQPFYVEEEYEQEYHKADGCYAYP